MDRSPPLPPTRWSTAVRQATRHLRALRPTPPATMAAWLNTTPAGLRPPGSAGRTGPAYRSPLNRDGTPPALPIDPPPLPLT